jgi:multiple antibiotic resistance protein
VSHVFDGMFFGSAFVTLFVIMDPVGTVPVFLALTTDQNGAQRARSALRAVSVALGVIVAFAVFGESLLSYLHISLPALECAGGLLLLLISLQLLMGTASDPEATTNVDVALVPLGTPLLAGPGAIVTTMVQVRRADGHLALFISLALAVLAVHVCLWLAMRFSGPISRLLGPGGVGVVTRIAGLLLSAIAVQLVADAVTAFIKAG